MDVNQSPLADRPIGPNTFNLRYFKTGLKTSQVISFDTHFFESLIMNFIRSTQIIFCSVSLCFITACISNPTKPPEGSDPNYDKAGQAKAVQVKQTERGVQITSDERVLFETGRADIKSDGMVYVERVASILKTKTKANVAIEGHTDNVGGTALNQQLSLRRANAVKDALVKQGVPATRIQAQGFGLSKPIADNATAEGRQSNRRTELIVLGESEANISGPAGSPGLADQLGAGLDKFLKNAGDFLKNAFGGNKKAE